MFQNPSAGSLSPSSFIQRDLQNQIMGNLPPSPSRKTNLKSSSFESMDTKLDQSHRTQDTTRTDETDTTESFQQPTVDLETYARLVNDLFQTCSKEKKERKVHFETENPLDVSNRSIQSSDNCFQSCYLSKPVFVQRAGAKFEPTPEDV